jgi:hypothetical protein
LVGRVVDRSLTYDELECAAVAHLSSFRHR